MANLNDNDLLDIVQRYEVEARTSLSTRVTEDNDTTRRYNGELYGNEVEGFSQVVSEDVKDTVESDMPSLIRSILNSGEICKFKPNNPNDKADVLEAQQKTDYADYLIRGRGDSYKTNYDFIKSVDMYKCGVMKYYYEDVEDVLTESYDNVPLEGLEQLDALIQSKPYYVDHKETKAVANDDGTYNLTVEVKTSKPTIKVVPIPNENLLISNEAADQRSLGMIGDISTVTRGSLVAQGYNKKIIASLNCSVGNSEGESARLIRFDDESGISENDYGEWANQSVELVDMYPLIDYNQDGIAERMHVIKSGDVILLKERFDHTPYAVASAIPTPHSAIGEGRAQQVKVIQKVKTSIERGILDNIYAVNNPEEHYNDNVNPADMMASQLGKRVKHKGEAPPAQNIQHITTPFIGQEAMLVLQQQDQKKAKLVGGQLANQGLNKDDINAETATRFNGVQKAEAAKLELVIRNICEIGYRKLTEGLIWTAKEFQESPVMLNIGGKSKEINPSKWRYDHEITVEVGLGSGNNEETVNNLTSLWGIHTQLKTEGSSLTDEAKRYNVLKDLIGALEMKDASRYFNNPEEPEEQLQADNEKLNIMVLQMQEQMQILQQQAKNPLVEAETINAKKDLLESKQKLKLEWAEFAESKRQFNIEAKMKAEKQDEDVALELTKIDAKRSTK